MKKFWKYFTIVLLLLVGLFCVGLLYLFFVPGSSLFGLTYISYNKKLESQIYHMNNVHTIKMNSRSYNVNVVTSASENISAVVQSKSLGYTLKKYSSVNISTSLENGILTINVTEPHGAVIKNSSFIELRIPDEITPELHLSNKSASTTIDKSTVKLSTLKYKTSTGNFHLSKATVLNKLDLNLNRAKFNVSENALIDNTSVDLRLTSGQFNAKSKSFNIVNVLSNKYGVIDIKSCANFVIDGKSAGGTIKIDTASAVDIESSDTNINIKNLFGGTIILTESGKVKINTVHGYSSIETKSGSITILNANAPVELNSTSSGNIKVNNATRAVTATSISGDITVNFAETAGEFDGSVDAFRKLIANTTNGNISATGVENVTIDVDSKGTSNINLIMRNVIGSNVIMGKRGNVYVKVPTNSEYTLTTITSSGSVYVNAGQFAVNGYTDKEKTSWISTTNPTATNDYTFIINTTSGALTVVDEMTA